MSIFNNMALRLLSNGAKLLLGSADWSKVLTTVSMLMMDTALTGDQKRQKAIELLENAVKAGAGSLLNLAIEIAVQWLKAQME